MNKIYWFVAITVLILLFQIGFLGRFFQNLNLSLVLPIIFIISYRLDLEQCLLIAISYGFILDIASLERFPFWSLLLIAEVLIVHFSQKKLVDFNHNIVAFLGLVVISTLRILLQFIIYSEGLLNLNFTMNLLSNFLLCAAVLVLWVLIENKWKIFAINEKRPKGI